MRPELRPPEIEPSPLDEVGPPTKSINLTWLIVLLVATGLGLAGWKVLGSSSDGWLHDLGAGVDAAAASGKPMFVFYTADWCPPCRELKRDVLSDPDVDAFLSENYVRVKIDLTDRQGPNAWIASDNGVRGIPTVIVYDDDGMEIDRVTGGSALTYWLRTKSAY
jgi:protein disulfide-isomerase